MSLVRIYGIFLEHIFRLRHSWEEIVDTFYWPIMDIILWGFLTIFISKQNGFGAIFVSFLMGGIILWTIVWRAQQDISLSLLVDVWSQNLLNVFGTPLTPWEFLIATILLGFVKILLTLGMMVGLAYLFYSFSLFNLGFYLIPFLGLLLVFGWSMGIFITALIIYFGRRIQNFAWSFLILLQPISCVTYPLTALPDWIKPIALSLPTTHIFEGMRLVLQKKALPSQYLINAAMLDIVYLILSVAIFAFLFERARTEGRLVKVQE
jgi:ABC-2 type transport system permease protein